MKHRSLLLSAALLLALLLPACTGGEQPPADDVSSEVTTSSLGSLAPEKETFAFSTWNAENPAANRYQKKVTYFSVILLCILLSVQPPCPLQK